MKPDEQNVPRREFLKFTAALTGAAASGVYLTTDAKLNAQPPVALLMQVNGGQRTYGY